MRQRVETASRIRLLFAAMWARMLFRETETSTALALHTEADTELMEAARREVDALAPACAGQWETEQPRASTRVTPAGAIAIVLGVATGAVAGAITLGSSAGCTFADGSTVEGECMFVDEFAGITLDPTKWTAIDDYAGPINGLTPELSCFRHENVSVSGGYLNLSVTDEDRTPCPQSWSATAYYTANYNANWPPNANTSYQTAVVDMSHFRFTYGTVSMRIKHPGGVGPGGAAVLWGANCQRAAGSINALIDLFNYAPGGRTCDWPAVGSQETDITAYCAARSPGSTLDTSIYVSETPGSPAAISTYFGIPYYGALYGQPPAAGYTTFLPYPGIQFADPAANWHTYELDWRPNMWRVSIDGTVVASETPTGTSWIPTTPMYMMLWADDIVTVTAGTLPQTMQIDYVRIWCPSGVPCTWSNL